MKREIEAYFLLQYNIVKLNHLHKNPDPENIPCFRVVNFKGELAGAFAFGGEGEQAKRLEEDGVEVKNGKVDLKKFGINSN